MKKKVKALLGEGMKAVKQQLTGKAEEVGEGKQPKSEERGEAAHKGTAMVKRKAKKMVKKGKMKKKMGGY